MKLSVALALGLALLGQTSCSESGSKMEASRALHRAPVAAESSTEKDATVDEAKTIAASDSAPPAPPAAPASPIPVAAPATRLLIYHADVKLKTAAMRQAQARLDSLVRRSSGYLNASTETHADGEWQQETTIRVPPGQFQALLSGLAGLGTIEEKKLSTDDVTAEHADVAARLAAKRAVEKQYTVLLGRAQKIQDILDIEEKLGGVREEIEATESRLKTLNDEVAYSTITLTIYQPITQNVPDAPVVSLGSRIVGAVYDGWQLLTSLLVGAINLWPLLLLAAGGWWLWRRRKARRPVAGPVLPIKPIA